MNQEFGTSLPIRVLFQANTVSQLASLIGKQGETKAEDWPILIPIQTHGTRAPLFLRRKAECECIGISDDVPRVWATTSLFTACRCSLRKTLRSISMTRQYRSTAEEYVRAIRTVQPHGPYNLVGQCQGAFIAFEMVRQWKRKRKSCVC